MAAHKPESKREEFRRYLDKTGVMDALTRVLVSLYEEPEKPTNAIEYFMDHLANGVPVKAELDNITAEVEELKRKIADLQAENEKIRHRLEQYEPQTTNEELPSTEGNPTAVTEPETDEAL